MSMEPIVQLSGKYSQELASTFEGLRQRSTVSVAAAQEQLQALQQQAEQLKQVKPEELVGPIQDMSPAEIPTPKVLDTFGWLTVMNLFMAVTSVLSSLLLAPLVSLFVEPFAMVLLAYALVPGLLYRQVVGSESEQEQRLFLLAGAVLEGALVGCVTANRYLSTAQPLAALTPLVIGLVAQLGEGKFGTRQAFLGATLGGSLAVHLAEGVLFGQLSFPFLLLAGLYAGVGFVTLQLLIKDPQVLYFAGQLVAQGLVFGIFGGAQPSA